MEQVVKVITTLRIEMLVHGTEPIADERVTTRIVEAMNESAAQFIVCAEHERATFPPWIATISAMDVSVDRIRTIDIDLSDDD